MSDDARRFILRNDSIRDNAAAFVRMLVVNPEKPYEVSVKFYKAKRSLAQNSYYWGVVVHCIQNYVNEHRQEGTELYSDEDIHEFLKQKFLPTRALDIKGDAKTVRKSTASLNTKQMTDYLESVDRYCATDLGLLLPRPEDLYQEAMGQ